MTVFRILFIVGLALMALGWMFDRVAAFPWLLRWVAPSDVAAREALDALGRDAKLGIMPSHAGFAPLLERWPNMADRERVRIIGRSVAVMKFGFATISNDFELIPYANQTEQLQPVWSAVAARALVQESLDRRIFAISLAVFLIGLVIAALTGWPS